MRNLGKIQCFSLKSVNYPLLKKALKILYVMYARSNKRMQEEPGQFSLGLSLCEFYCQLRT